MASGKRDRASMREGPLADLFRRTDKSAAPPREPQPEDTPPRAAAARPRGAGGARSGAAAAEPAHPRSRARGRAGPVDPVAGPPVPSEPAPPIAEEPPAHVPEPKERLRNVFSTDIPENILDRDQPRYGRDPHQPAPAPWWCSRCCASSASAVPASTRSSG